MRDLFASREFSFNLVAKVNDDITLFQTEYRTVDNRTDAATVDVHDALAFGTADVLGQELLCSLDSLTTKGGGREFHIKAVACLSVFVEVASFIDEHVAFVHFSNFFGSHVRVVVRIVIDNFDVQEHMDFVGFHVDIDVDLLFDVQILAGRRNKSLLEGVQNHGIIDTLVFNDFLEYVEQVYFRFVLHIVDLPI